MKHILWHQNAHLNAKELFIIDYKREEYSNLPEQNAAFDKLIEGQKWRRYVCPALKESDTVPADSHIEIYVNDKTHEILVKSHFIEVDEIGRRIPFMFYSHYSSESELLTTLERNLQMASYSISQGDKEVIRKAISNPSSIVIAIFAAALTVAIITAALVLTRR